MAHQQDMFQKYMASSGYPMTGSEQQPQQQQPHPQQQQQQMHPNLNYMQHSQAYPSIDPQGFALSMYHPSQYQPHPQQSQQSPVAATFSPQGVSFMPNQGLPFSSAQMSFQQPQQQQQQPQHVMSANGAHPGMIYNNPASIMSLQSMQTGVSPMVNQPSAHSYSRPANNFPVQGGTAMNIHQYNHPQQQQHQQHQPHQQHQQRQPHQPHQQQHLQQLQHFQQFQQYQQRQRMHVPAQQQQHLRSQQHQLQQQRQFIQSHQPSLHFQQPTPSPAASRPRRPTRNTKKRVTYDESSDEDDMAFLSEQSDHSDGSEFEDSDGGYKKKGSKKNAQAQATAEAEEAVVIPLGTKVFERILDYRQNEETGAEELLVKYKHTSFHHVEWVPMEQIENEHLGKHRVKKFLQKWHQDGQRGEDFRDNLIVDRVIDEGELTDPVTGQNSIYFLVKWKGLFYDASTWEKEEDLIKIDAKKIQEFHARRQIPQVKMVNPPQRPNIMSFMKYEVSPQYRYGNQLRSYQLEGLNWLRFCYYSYRSCILADEMGLGKTVQSVAFLNDIYYALNNRGPFLIVAPLSTIPHWIRAFNAWTDLNVIDFRGSTQSRNLLVETEFYYKDMQGNIIPNRYKFDVLVTTYEMASAGAALLRDIPWKCGVFDEAHRLKNKQSKVLEVLKTFYLEQKVLLTGTPLQNNLDELYSLLNFMQPEYFNDEKLFFAEYGSLQSAAQVERLQALLKPIMLRRFKEDVEKTIPVKEETVIEVELTNPQKKWYRAILERNFSFLKKGAKSNKELPHLRNIMMQLRKCCIHPYLLEGAEEVILSECHAKLPKEQFNCLVQSSGKLVLIDKLLEKLIKGNHKVLIFSQFTTCLDILADYLRGRGYAHERIDGSIPGDQRQAAIDRFTTLPIEESFVFLLCTRAGGVGINLTAADTCIIFDSDWNPQNDLQAQARCHRIGQTKPVQIYRLICRNTYEKDMFDRAGLKLGLDKAVMQRSGPSSKDDGSARGELSKKEIEDLLKKGAYGAIMDDESSTKFCEEDIDQILERRTTVIRHEGNEKGSIFSKASFTAADESFGVEIDDPDFWEKWAAKANIEATEEADERKLVTYEPRRRRAVQRFGSKPADGSYSSNDNADDSDAYEEEPERSRKREQMRPWTLSEKTKYERKLMIYGYGNWSQMKAFFPRRSEKDLKAVTRALMRKVLPVIEKNSEEDRKLIEDIEHILDSDNRDEVRGNLTVPYSGATKKQIAEFRSFLIEVPDDYIEHIERKGRNFLLRIQMLYLIREKIVPKNWKEAKELPIPKVTGSPPAPWWGENEDRDLLLGIYKHGYQQYLAMRNDKEFCFYGRKYDDSHAGSLEDDDAAPANSTAEEKTPEYEESNETQGDDNGEQQVLVWPSKADIGMRLRRIIAAFLREHANSLRKRKISAKEQRKESNRRARTQEKESRQAQRQRAKLQEFSNRWSKKNKSDFLKTVLSFGVETSADDPDVRWTRFKEIAGLEKKTDESLDLYYQKFVVACEEIVKRHQQEAKITQESNAAATTTTTTPAATVQEANGSGSPSNDQSNHVGDSHPSPGSNAEPQQSAGGQEDDEGGADREDAADSADTDLVPYDKARRALRRIEQMKIIREKVMVHPDLDTLLMSARKTSGLPSWWEVPIHDKALLEGICNHGFGRHDLMLNDTELPFYEIKQRIAEEESIQDADSEGLPHVMEKMGWPKDLVIARRIDALCELVLRPKPPPKRPAASRKRKTADTASKSGANAPSAPVQAPALNKMDQQQNELDYQSDGSEYSRTDDAYYDSAEDTNIMHQDAERLTKKIKYQNMQPPLSTDGGSPSMSSATVDVNNAFLEPYNLSYQSDESDQDGQDTIRSASDF